MRPSRSASAVNASMTPSICSSWMLSSTAMQSSSLPEKFEYTAPLENPAATATLSSELAA